MPTRAEVLAAARLAQVPLDADELDRLTGELNAILERTDVLHAFEQEAPPSDTHELPEKSTLPSAARSDRIDADTLALQPSCFAPGWRDGFFTVPRLRTHDTSE